MAKKIKKKKKRRQPAHRREASHHWYDPEAASDDWVVPFVDGRAIMQHAHGTDPADHSQCGPLVFCCVKAARRYVQLRINTVAAKAQWRRTSATLILQWMSRGVDVLYFSFCDPAEPRELRSIAVGGLLARQVLRRRVSLESQIEAPECTSLWKRGAESATAADTDVSTET